MVVDLIALEDRVPKDGAAAETTQRDVAGDQNNGDTSGRPFDGNSFEARHQAGCRVQQAVGIVDSDEDSRGIDGGLREGFLVIEGDDFVMDSSEPALDRHRAFDGFWMATPGSSVSRLRHERRPLTAAQLTDIGHGLYKLLGRFSGYQVAQVGWDPEGLVDLVELRQEQTGDLLAGTLPGLVLAEDVLPEVRGPAFVPFRTGFVWLPYAGQLPSTLTADA